MITLELNSTPSSKIITTTLQILSSGGLVIFPTETVYGALVDATNPQAVEKLLNFKKRRPGKALSIACCDEEMASKYVQINAQAQKIYRSLLPGPITVISASLNKVSPGVASEFNTIGVRIPDYPLLLQIIKKYQKPLTATSANLSGKKNPYSISDVFNNLSQKQKKLVDLVIDAGQLVHNPPSQVIDTTQTSPLYLRNNNFLSSDKLNSQETFKSTSVSETQTLAAKLIFRHFDQIAQTGLVIGLDGELGAGKTTFTQGIAKFLQIEEPLSSPTYNYIKEYNFHKNDLSGHLFHLDVWKINSAAELQLLDLKSILKPKNLVLIEWWSQISPFTKIDIPFLQIEITELPDHNRQISLFNYSKKETKVS